MLQYGCHFVTYWHAHQGQATLLKMTERCGYWLSAEERRERFVHCKSHRLLYWLKHVEASLVWFWATGHLHLQILNWSVLFPGHQNMSCCTLILQGKIHTGCSASGKATLFWNNMRGILMLLLLKRGRANTYWKHIESQLPKRTVDTDHVSYYIVTINLGGTI